MTKRAIAPGLLALSLLPVGMSAFADDPDTEIRALISAVENSDCDFIRNGNRHSAAAAADHLRLKYRRGKRYADSAEHFIERLASKSSWSGSPYLIECNGEAQGSGDWLRERLDALRD